MNLEHPPLVKYMIAATTVLGLGEQAARLVGVGLAGAAIGLTVAAVSRACGQMCGAVALGALALDTMYMSMAPTVMLDGYVASLVLIAAVLAMRGRDVLAGAFAGLALSAKLTALPAVLALPLLSCGTTRRKLAAYIGVPAAVFAASYAPLLFVVGPVRLFDGVVGGLEWFVTPGHISYRLLDMTSAPWHWPINVNPFFLGGEPLLVNPASTAMWVAVSLTGVRRGARELLGPVWRLSLVPWMFIGGMSAVFAVGNHTMFNFYFAAVSPLASLSGALGMYILFGRGKPLQLNNL